jgi:hypothetical protein
MYPNAKPERDFDVGTLHPAVNATARITAARIVDWSSWELDERLSVGEVIRRHLADSRERIVSYLDACRFGSGVIQSRIGGAAAPDHIGLDDRQTRACRSCSNPSYTKAGSSRSMAGKVSFSRQ